MNLFQIKDNNAIPIPSSDIEKSERSIEELIEQNPKIILGDKLLIIGRQVKTDSGKILDLLAVDKEGRLVVIELKKGYAPREIVAQILDYSSWLRSLSERRIEDIAKNYFQKKNSKNKSLSDVFIKFYHLENCPEIGKEVVNILFAKEFSEEVINPAKYLSEFDLSIYCIRFDTFVSKQGEYIITDNIVGDFDEYYSGTSEVRSDKYDNRNIIKQLVSYLQENYSNACSELRFEKLFDFKLYQSRDGEWTCAYIDWVYDDGAKFCIEVGIQSATEEGLILYSYFQSRNVTEALNKKVHSGESIKLLSELEDESENNRPSFGKFQKIDSVDFESLKKFADKEVNNLLKVIETF